MVADQPDRLPGGPGRLGVGESVVDTAELAVRDVDAFGGEVVGERVSFRPDGGSPSATAPTKPSGSESTEKDSTSGGAGSNESSSGGSSSDKSPGGGESEGGAACSTKNTEVTFIASAHHASEQEPAAATVKVTNTSDARTIVGASVLTAKDEQGKAEPISADTAGNGTDAVGVKPGGTAEAMVLYTDLNFEGTASARETCAVQASEVEIALPDDVGRSVQVTKADGSAGIFNVCAPEVKFDGFGV